MIANNCTNVQIKASKIRFSVFIDGLQPKKRIKLAYGRRFGLLEKQIVINYILFYKISCAPRTYGTK